MIDLPPSIAVITDVSDIPAAFDITYACFGEQVPDAILQALNPAWDTPDGRARAMQRMSDRFEAGATFDKDGDPTVIFLKATVTTSENKQQITGFAIWQQFSMVQGQGISPMTEPRDAIDVEALYPGDQSEQEYLCTLLTNLNQQKRDLVEQQASACPPAVLALDLCVVHPSYQRQGIATRLVQWGLDEAKRRGGLVCCMEASPMGRQVYKKLGFISDGPEIDYKVNGAKFARNGMPSNVFMRTH